MNKELIVLTICALFIGCSLKTIYSHFFTPKKSGEEKTTINGVTEEISLGDFLKGITLRSTIEEAIFRSPLYFCATFSLLAWSAIIGTSILFMCVHLGIVWIRTPLFGGWRFRLISKEGKKLIEIREKIYYGITVFLMGLLLGIVMVETHNLLVPIIVHAGVNFYGGIDISFPRRAENQ